MSSYQITARGPSRDASTSGLPAERRRFWVELPGWVTSWVREKTEVRKTSTSNAHVYDVLCTQWKVPKSFGVATEERVVYVMTEAMARRETSSIRAGGVANLQRQTWALELVQVIEFLVENSSAKPARLGWLDPHLMDKLQDLSPDDWIIFPAPDLVHWLSDDVSKAAEKSLRHISNHHPSPVCVFGNFNHPSNIDPSVNNDARRFSAASMQLSQIWHHGFFVTLTSKAAASNVEGLRRLHSKLVARQYEALENPTTHQELQMWMSLHTYRLLIGGWTMDGGGVRSDTRLAACLRAFNQIHDPDMPAIPILNRDRMDSRLRDLFAEAGTSTHLMTSAILNKLKIPRPQLPQYVAAFRHVFGPIDSNGDELASILHLADQLVKTFWMFRLAFIIVSDEEIRHSIPSSDRLSRCQLVSFDTLLRLIDQNFVL